jgi:hypothetical protein
VHHLWRAIRIALVVIAMLVLPATAPAGWLGDVVELLNLVARDRPSREARHFCNPDRAGA